MFTFPDGQKLALEVPPGAPYKDGKWEGQDEYGARIMKPVSTGLLLVGGRFIPGPYQLARVGACVFVNGELVNYYPGWEGEGQFIEDPVKRHEYVMNGLDGMELLELWNPLAADSIVPLRLDDGGSYRNGLGYVFDLKSNCISENTYTWAEMMVSRKPLAEKQRFTGELMKKRATGFSNYSVCFRLSDEDIRRLCDSDKAAFLRQLRWLVNRTVQKRADEELKAKERDGGGSTQQE